MYFHDLFETAAACQFPSDLGPESCTAVGRLSASRHVSGLLCGTADMLSYVWIYSLDQTGSRSVCSPLPWQGHSLVWHLHNKLDLIWAKLASIRRRCCCS
jgi:hypothetical protein